MNGLIEARMVPRLKPLPMTRDGFLCVLLTLRGVVSHERSECKGVFARARTAYPAAVVKRKCVSAVGSKSRRASDSKQSSSRGARVRSDD